MGSGAATLLRMLEQLELPIWVHDFGRNNIPWANPAGLALWNASSVDELAARDLEMSDASAKQLEVLRQRLGSGERVTMQRTFYPKEEPVTVRLAMSSWTLSDGSPAMLVEATPTLSEDIEAGVLRGLEAVRHATQMIGLYDADGRPVMANPAMELFFGADTAFAATFLDPSDAELASRIVESGGTFRREVAAPAPHGPTRFHDVAVRAVLDPVTGAGLRMVHREDVTARHRADSVKDELVAVVSHELRTPLTSLLGALKLLAATTQLEPKQAALLQVAARNADRLLHQVNDLLDLQKLAAGQIQLERSPISACELARRAVDDNFGLSERHGVHFALIRPDERHPIGDITLDADAGRILQVLTNLMSNAAKFSPANGKVDVVVQPRASSARYEVVDRGPGVPEAFRPYIFDRFSQADSSDSRPSSGTGLGLFIARSIVEAHGGIIDFTTGSGGTTFWFELPATAPPQD